MSYGLFVPEARPVGPPVCGRELQILAPLGVLTFFWTRCVFSRLVEVQEPDAPAVNREAEEDWR
jgi:hypothetical protein